MVKVFQLAVEVGRCWLPESGSNSDLQYVLSVELTRDLSAATSIKRAEKGIVNFGTRLFVRLDKLPLDKIPTCLIVLTSIDKNGNRLKIAFAELLAKSEGLQQFNLKGLKQGDKDYTVELQFGSSMVEAKENRAKNNKSNSFKGSFSKKQSSCEQGQSKMKKKGSNFQSMGALDRSTSKESLQLFGQTAKVSNHDESNNISKQELQTSAATSKPEIKTVNTSKHDETANILAWQMKVDQLEEQLSIVSNKLNQCNCKFEQTLNLLDKQRNINKRLEMEKEELKELLTLEESRAKMSFQYMAKMNRLLEEISKGDKAIFDQIEEKDEIIMLNEQLENEVNTKQELIEGLKAEIHILKDKIVGFETKLTPAVSIEPSSIKKLQNLPGKELKEVKSQKRLTDRKTSTWNKKQEDKTKQTNSSKQATGKKERQVHKAAIKKERQVKVPVKNKIPTQRNQIPSARIPKGGKPLGKHIKTEPNKVQSDKKSSIDSSLQILSQELDGLREPTNLMLNSRSIQQEVAKIETN